MFRYVVFLVLFWLAAYGAINLVIGQDDPPRCFCSPDCKCKGCKCDNTVGRVCCEDCKCINVVKLPGVKKLPDGTYDLTAFFQAELRKKVAAQCLVCGFGCCDIPECCCCDDCKTEPSKAEPIKEICPFKPVKRHKLFGVGRFHFRKH